MKAETESMRERNEHFWLEMTKKSTLVFCHEMLKVSEVFQIKRPADVEYNTYLESIDNEILKFVDLLNEYDSKGRWDEISKDDSPFPSDLYGYIHEYNTDGGWFQPKHLMCKLAGLRDEVNKINYEFLIEYDILSPDVEIYFGVKAISDDWESTDEFKNIVIEHWRLVHSGRYKRHTHRFKMTNNVNHGTFWPFWWRIGLECKEELADALKYLETFYRDYKNILNLRDLWRPKFNRIAINVANSLLSNEDYDDLMSQIARDYNEETSRRFERLLNESLNAGLIIENNLNGKRFNCVGSTVKMVCIIRGFFTMTAFSKKKEWEDKHTPIGQIEKIILDKTGRIINESYWRKNTDQMHDQWVSALNTLEVLFPDLKK